MTDQAGQQELREIRRLMLESQRTVSDHGAHFVVWGLLISVSLVVGHLSRGGVLPVPERWLWVGAIAMGWAFSLWKGWSESRTEAVRSLANQVLTGIWVACGISLTILGFLSMGTGLIGWRALAAVICVVIGLCYFASGTIYRDPWIRPLACAWWLGGIAFFTVPALPYDLTLAAMIIAFQVAPGVVRYRRARAEVGQLAE